MSAECEKHGVDLQGDTFTGLVCPVCDLESQVEYLDGLVEEYIKLRGNIAILVTETSPLTDPEEVGKIDAWWRAKIGQLLIKDFLKNEN